MLLRTARDLGHLLKDGRRRLEWSQTRLAEEAGVSRQWVSMVESGKTSVEFDLALGCLQALGYVVLVDSENTVGRLPSPGPGHLEPEPESGRPTRTRLTIQGRAITPARSRRGRFDRGG